jgi:hypothetical protein
LTAKVKGTGPTVGHQMQFRDTTRGVSGLVQPLRDHLDWLAASVDGVERMVPATKQGEEIRAGAITDNQHLLTG